MAPTVNAAAVQRLFQNKSSTGVRSSSSKQGSRVAVREKGFSPSGTRVGAVDRGSASLYKSGAHIVAASGGDKLLSTASQFAKHLSEENLGASGGSPQRDNSCFLLRCRKQLHGLPLDTQEKAKLQNVKDSELDQAVAFRKNLYVVRHEQRMERRRALDPYLQLTGAQVDLHAVIPNPDGELASRGWMISNSYRQQLCRTAGVPLMTRIMRGDYYEPKREPPRPKRDVVALNKVHLRAASAAARLVGAASRHSK